MGLGRLCTEEKKLGVGLAIGPLGVLDSWPDLCFGSLWKDRRMRTIECLKKHLARDTQSVQLFSANSLRLDVGAWSIGYGSERACLRGIVVAQEEEEEEEGFEEFDEDDFDDDFDDDFEDEFDEFEEELEEKFKEAFEEEEEEEEEVEETPKETEEEEEEETFEETEDDDFEEIDDDLEDLDEDF